MSAYVDLLSHWNSKINLLAPADLPQVWARHIADSLQLVPLIRPGTARAIDLGSGAGFPGLMIAIATGIHVDLIESDTRKAAFLREAARLTAAPATVHPCRIEAATPAPAPLVTARALAPLSTLLELAHRLLAPGGQCLFPKGKNAGAELTHARARWHMDVIETPSLTAKEAVILNISGLRRR